MKEHKGISAGYWEYFGLGLTVAVLYGEFVYRRLSFSSGLVSFGILAVLVIGCTWLGSRLHPFGTDVSLFCSVVEGYGLYTLLAYGPLYGYPLLMGAILGAAALLAAAYTALLLKMKIQTSDPERRERVRRGRRRRAAKAVQWIAAGGFTLMMAACVAAQWLDYPALQTAAGMQGDSGEDGQTILSNLDTLVLLQEDAWAELSVQQKLEVLQTVANIESQDLGLPEPLTVVGVSDSLELSGSYEDENRRIRINLSNLREDPAEEALDSLLHEAYHSYQHRLVDLYDTLDPENQQLIFFRSVAQYKAEFEDYTDSEEDLTGYYFQRCEQDARTYAELTTQYYFEQIEGYLAEQQTQPTQTEAQPYSDQSDAAGSAAQSAAA